MMMPAPFCFTVVTDDGTPSPTNASCLHLPHRCEENQLCWLLPSWGCNEAFSAVERAVLHSDKRSSICVEHKETKHKDAFTRPPEGLETGLQGARSGFIMRFEDSEMKAEDTDSSPPPR